MQITKNSKVILDYALKNENGDVLDSSKENNSLIYIHGHGSIITGLESALEGRNTGDKFSISLLPEQAFGIRDDNFVHNLPKDRFSDLENLAVGLQVEVEDQHGVRIMTISQIQEETVTLDGNHELAGMNLNMDVDIIEVCEATAEELEKAESSVRDCAHDCGSDCNTC